MEELLLPWLGNIHLSVRPSVCLSVQAASSFSFGFETLQAPTSFIFFPFSGACDVLVAAGEQISHDLEFLSR